MAPTAITGDTNISETLIDFDFTFNDRMEDHPVAVQSIDYVIPDEGNEDTGISITQDLYPEDRQGNKILRTHLKTAKDQNLDAKIKGQNLIVDGNSFSIDDLIDLEKADAGNEVPEETAVPTTDNNIKKDRSKNRTRIQYSPQSLPTIGGRSNVRGRTQKNETK
ncbi:hypothetical protein JTB14_025823 [Gonioctena quinquepunctata]|nr:hypothetical protein JTB14_025823 [Gonioctena quinquepunctata]